MSNFTKIRVVGAEFLHAGRRTDGRTDGIPTGRQAFRNFANATKNYSVISIFDVIVMLPSVFPLNYGYTAW